MEAAPLNANQPQTLTNTMVDAAAASPEKRTPPSPSSPLIDRMHSLPQCDAAARAKSARRLRRTMNTPRSVGGAQQRRRSGN